MTPPEKLPDNNSLSTMAYPADRFVRVLALRGSATHRGELHGVLLGRDIRETIQQVLDAYATDAMGLTTVDIARLAARMGTGHMDELVEIAAIARASGIDPDGLLAWNTFDDIWAGMACSSFAVWGRHTADGRLWCGRNTDFPAAWAPLSAVVGVTAPESGVSSLCPSFPGHLGGYGGFNAAGVAVLANLVEVLPGRGAVVGLPVKWIVARMLRECSSLEQAVVLAQTLPSAAGCSLLCVGKDADGRLGAAVVEKVGETSAVRWPKGELMVTANHFDTDKMCSFQPGAALRYSLPRCDALEAVLESAESSLNLPTLADALATPPVCMVAVGEEEVTTVQSMIFDVAAQRAWVAQGRLPAPAGGYTPLSLTALLRVSSGLLITPYRAARHGVVPRSVTTDIPY
ncbi:MAG: hypothetical protein HUU55_11065 [Myxococcales bacterium]|nr:hypothetical protein [Myxococcales bacterium]